MPMSPSGPKVPLISIQRPKSRTSTRSTRCAMPSSRRSNARSAKTKPAGASKPGRWNGMKKPASCARCAPKKPRPITATSASRTCCPSAWTDAWRDQSWPICPNCPWSGAQRFIEQYGLPEYDADILTAERSLSDYFEAAVKAYGGDPKRVSNWLMNDVLRMINDQGITAGPAETYPGLPGGDYQAGRCQHDQHLHRQSPADQVQESGQRPGEIVQAEGSGPGQRRFRQSAQWLKPSSMPTPKRSRPTKPGKPP